MDPATFSSPEWNALPVADKARQLYEAGKQAAQHGEHDTAHAYFGQSLNLCRGLDDKRGIARALVAQASLVGWVRGDFGFERRQVLAKEALALFREIGDKPGMASALRQLASVAATAEAEHILNQGLALSEEAGDKPGIAAALSHLGNAASAAQDKPRACELLARAVGLYRAMGDKPGLAPALTVQALATDGEEFRKACLEEALTLHRELGNTGAVGRTLTMLAGLVYPDDADPRNEPYLVEALAIERERGNAMAEAQCLKRLAQIARARGNREQADALDAQSAATYTIPEPDPELIAALESGNSDTARERMLALFQSSRQRTS